MAASIADINQAKKARLKTRLRRCYEALRQTCLQRFLLGVLGNPVIQQPFFTLPASITHHHSQPGGLLTHSLECAEFVLDVPELDPIQRDLGIVAGLLHDVGKIPLWDSNGKRTKAGFLLHHEALTLEVLAPHLRLLDKAWPDGEVTLRYLLSPAALSDHPRRWMTVREVIQAADHISASRDGEHLASQGLPDWRNSALLDVPGPKRCYWRPTPPASTLG